MAARCFQFLSGGRPRSGAYTETNKVGGAPGRVRRSVQHFGHTYLGPSKVTATSHIPEEFSSIIQTYNAAMEQLGLSHPPPPTKSRAQCISREGASATTETTPC